MPALRSTPGTGNARLPSTGHWVGPILCLSILLSLSVCRSTSAASDLHPTPNETSAITTPATTGAPTTSPQLSARQAMKRFLELIRGSKTVADITPERMGAVMGVVIQAAAPGHYGYGQALPGHWAFSMERQEPASAPPRVSLSFSPIPGKPSSADAACEPDFAHFSQALQDMGFSREASRGEHGRRVFDLFERSGMRVEVSPRRAFRAG